MVLGDSSQQTFVVRRPDDGGATGVDLHIRAGTGTSTDGSVVIGDLANNRAVCFSFPSFLLATLVFPPLFCFFFSLLACFLVRPC